MNRKFIPVTLLLLSFLTANICQAKEETIDHAPPSQELIVFLGGKIIDGTGNPPRADGTLIVQDGKIKEVSDKPPKNIPAGARVIDVRGKTIMPSLIAAHCHLGLVQGTTTDSAHQTEANDKRQLKLYGSYGIGAVLSLGTDADFIYSLREKRQQCLLGGPYILTAGHGFGVPDGAPPLAMGMKEAYRPKTVENIRQEVSELATHHPDVVKLWVDDFGGKMPSMSPEIYRAIIDEAHRHQLRVYAHVWYLADAKRLLADGVDVFAHSIRDLPVDQELVDGMKAKGVYVIPTLSLDEAAYIYKENPQWMKSKFFNDALEPGMLEMFSSSKYVPSERERKALQVAETNLKTMFDAGVRIGFGTDSGAKAERVQGFSEHRELQLMVDAGLTPLQAIQCATKNNAEMLGIEKTMGTLERGKLANFVVLDADPSVDIRNTEKISSVWLDGAEQSLHGTETNN